MEGRGVTNYATDKPSYGFSTSTTEFDDALISRGIVSFEQAMIAKGASPQEAMRLTSSKEGVGCVGSSTLTERIEKNNRDDGSDVDNDDHSDDEEFIEKYRQLRLHEMKQQNSSLFKYGEVLHISRPDWTREVNEASKDGLWVIVNLTRNSSTLSRRHDEICDAVTEITKELADQYQEAKFVSIASTSAIENWPVENLPSLFCYRFGRMQHQLIGIENFGGPGVNKGRVEWRLAKLGVLETELEEDPKPDHYDRTNHPANRTAGDGIHQFGGKMSSQFGGTMSRLATTRDIDDFDDVD